MSNIGEIEMFVSQNGVTTYNVRFRIFDVIDTLYEIDQSGVTYEEALNQREILRNNGRLQTGFIERTVTKDRIPKTQIKSYLFDKTGDSQSDVLRRLDILYSKGASILKSQFDY